MNYGDYSNRRYPIIKVGAHRPQFRAAHPVWRVTTVLFGLVVTLCVLFAGNVPAQETEAQPILPGVTLMIDGKPLKTEIAATSQQRYMGLSFRPSMADDAGMLFVYDAERPLTFTMRNTLIPLSIAFISADLVINEIHDMDVGPNQLFDSRNIAMFALEVNQGWFEQNGIKAGAQIVMQ
ncbi:DUF192 domain-containing protein [Granulosicoccus antarcticus]|uniref:DUF192 domain-containing protein n=1 Tax=Granulosicoccus antarcticus IMCC3135 TaxID=1192854 RepID=A0A2Z2NLK8_9GAMM|nr:DUF192 domain-containing protein [Granulosicoccus antarcticus]ASJ71435.1 hypothetical protein IMCC3135_06640 [Granulosicoccus antarcticus IMCC3135]